MALMFRWDGNDLSLGAEVDPFKIQINARKSESVTFLQKGVQMPVKDFAVHGTVINKITDAGIATTQFEKCSEGNTKTWLDGSRIGNINESLLTLDFVRQNIVDSPTALGSYDAVSIILNQTMSHTSSRFRNYHDASITSANIRTWAVRLVYLSLHYHQHRHALREARIRALDDACYPVMLDRGVGLYDYECPSAKYLVVGLAKYGLGANVRAGAVKALVAGLATDRVVLFVNNVADLESATKDMGPWSLASCPRRDHQCFFLPLSPCVLLREELAAAHILDKGEMRALFKTGRVPLGRIDDRVLVLHLHFMPQLKLPGNTVELLQNYSYSLIEGVLSTDSRRPVMEQAIASFTLPDEPRPAGYNYALANSRIQHALMFYTMRPNLHSRKRIDEILKEIIPAKTLPERSVGIPIRASDKCRQESQCLSFSQHIEVSSLLWNDVYPNTSHSDQPTLIFTTESKDMMHEQHAYISNTTIPKPFANMNLLMNPHDVLPNTGFVEEIVAKTTSFSADDAMLSAVTSLQLQLLARYTIANCCSNFHTLLGDFLVEGMGAAHHNDFSCLQEHSDPVYAICCGWHKDCKQKRAAILLARNSTDETMKD